MTYNASNMVLAAHSNASYLSEPNARSRAGGHFFLSSDSTIPQNNGAVLNIAHIIKHVMSSATEAELVGLYIMAREAVYIRIVLEEMGHKQPPTPLQTDNAMAEAVTNGKVQPKRKKAMDMRFHWLRDRKCQRQFRIYWRPGKLNYADYWTKYHPAKHHLVVFSSRLYSRPSQSSLVLAPSLFLSCPCPHLSSSSPAPSLALPLPLLLQMGSPSSHHSPWSNPAQPDPIQLNPARPDPHRPNPDPT